MNVKSIETICRLFRRLLEIPLYFFQVFINLVVVYLLVVIILGKRDGLFSLPIEVVIKSVLNGLFDFLVFIDLFAAPVLTGLVHPRFVLFESLPHHTSWLSFFIPDFD